MLRYLIFFILSAGAFSTKINRVKDRIYTTLTSDNACFRILDATRQVGCQSAREGSHGVLHWLDNEKNATYILEDPGNRRPYIVAMDMKLFRNAALVSRLHESGKLNGMIVFRSDMSEDFDSFSEDTECPNEYSGLYSKDDREYGSCKKQKWNANATGYRFMDFKIPIFLVHNDTEKDILKKDCYLTYNQPMFGNPPKYPLCAVELLAFNTGAGTAIRCRRRNTMMTGLDLPTRVCDALNGKNVYTFMPPTNKTTELQNNSVLMLASRIDSFSMFSDYNPGAESSLGNVIMMLAIAEALGRSREFVTNSSLDTNRYLMPVFFDGESLDYIGSSRLVYDMQTGDFPYKYLDHLQDQPAHFGLQHLSFILELNQVTRPGKSGYSFHVDPVSMESGITKTAVVDVAKKLSASAPGVLNPNVDFGMPLPPASAHRFLLANRSIPALVITDHEQGFQNRHYNSFTDVPNRIDRAEVTAKIVDLSNAVVKLMLEWVSNGKTLPSDWKVNASVVERLMDCFWSWPQYKCPMFDRFNFVFYRWNESVQPFKRTYTGPAGNILSRIIEYTMAYFVGERIPMANASLNCNAATFMNRTGNRTGTIYSYHALVDLLDDSNNDTICVLSAVNISAAQSPAFVIEDYDFTKGEYSTWMESVWLETRMRIFLIPDPAWEGAVLTVGLLVMLLSLIIVYLIASGSDILFAPTPEVTAL